MNYRMGEIGSRVDGLMSRNDAVEDAAGVITFAPVFGPEDASKGNY
jgi:hypothetical protein